MKFIILLGPPAVGKMTIGQELTKALDYKLFHNHLSIELALKISWYGSPEFKKINEGIRQLVFKTVAESKEIKGFIFTLVMAFDLQEDWDYLNNTAKIFESHGWDIHYVELYAPLNIRLERNKTPNRLAHKESKRNIVLSEKGLLDIEKKYRINTTEGEFKGRNYLKVDTSDKSEVAIARYIADYFKL